MTFLTRKALTRRAMLKGLGASVALPLLDSMMPALSAQTNAAAPGSRQAPMRIGFVYAAHGVIHSEWKPRQTGRQYELPPNLQPLAGVRDHFNIFTNLSHLEADSKGDGSGDHNRASGAWLTGVHAGTARVRAARFALPRRPIRLPPGIWARTAGSPRSR